KMELTIEAILITFLIRERGIVIYCPLSHEILHSNCENKIVNHWSFVPLYEEVSKPDWEVPKENIQPRNASRRQFCGSILKA
ncbi:16476_t:CDS:2, partial [Gigaspora margarita]